MRKVSLLIDPEGISDELCRDRRRSFDDPSCLEIMDDTASNPSDTDTIIGPKIPILEPDQSTEVEIRNICKHYITVSDTLIRDDLSYLFVMDISDDDWRGERWDREGEKIRSIYENKEQYTSYDEKWDAGFFHEKEGITGTEDYSISKWY